MLSESVGKSLVDLPPSRFGGIVRSGGDEERCPEVLGYGPSLEPATVLIPGGRGRAAEANAAGSDIDLA